MYIQCRLGCRYDGVHDIFGERETYQTEMIAVNGD